MKRTFYKDFSGGLNTTDNPLELAANELQQCDNWFVDRRGQLYKRRGSIQVSSIALDSPVYLLHPYYNTEQRTLLMVSGANGTFIYNEQGNIVKSNASANLSGRYMGITLRGNAWFPDSNSMKYYGAVSGGDGAFNFPTWHVSVIADSPGVNRTNVYFTIPINDTNHLTGAYRYKVSHYGRFGEGPVGGYLEKYCTTGYYRTELNDIPVWTGDWYTGRKIWRATVIGGAEGKYRLVTNINNQTQTAYIDNLPDFSLGEKYKEPQVNETSSVNEWPGGQPFALFQERMFAVDTIDRSKLIWSRPNEPATWPTLNYEYVARDDGEGISALLPTGDRLLIFKPTHVYSLYGDFTEANPSYARSLVSNNVGARSPLGVTADGGVAYFMGDKAVYRLDGSINCVSRKIRKTLEGLPVGVATGKEAMIVYNRKLWLSLSEGGSVNDAIYVLDLDALEQRGEEVWARLNYGVSVFARCDLSTNESAKVYGLMGGTDAGHIWKLDTGWADGGVPVTAIAKTAPLDLGSQSRKRMRKVWGWFKVQPGSMTTVLQVDFGKYQDTHTIDDSAALDRTTIYRFVAAAKMQGMTLEMVLNNAVSGRSAQVDAIEVEFDDRPRR